jgi:transcriptional regulator with XRE-family HTH domain
MSDPKEPTIVGRGLGGELRALRAETTLSSRKVAAQLGWQASKISRMENGKQGIKVEDVASLLVVYGVTGKERTRLLKMAERSDEPGWWEVIGELNDESRTFIRIESEATAIYDFEPLIVPGLLQTAEYTKAVMKACGVTGSDAETRIAARMARQAILNRDEPPEFTMIVDEMVLRRVLGSPRTMARQLRHLAEVVESPTITFRVVPFDCGAYTGLDGSFMILDFPRNRSVVHLEHKLAALFLEEPEQIDFFRREAERLDEVALTPVKSLDFVARVATEHDRE